MFGHIVRVEPIKLVDGRAQKRVSPYNRRCHRCAGFENGGGIASGRIYNVGNPNNNDSVHELATMMIDLALTSPEYRETASQEK